MATFQAIATTCQTVMNLLQQNWTLGMFNNTQLQFKVYRTDDFTNPMSEGVSLFLYHVNINAVQRTLPSSRLLPPSNGKPARPRRPQLPLDIHFMLTPWAKEASMEQQILGWMMRTIEDYPQLSSGLLNATQTEVFADDETVDIVAGQLSNEEMFRIWDVLPGDFHISVPYIARVVRIDTDLEVRRPEMVLTRDLEFGVMKD